MKSSWHKRYTVFNNVNATHNLLAALVEARSDAHVVHLGTMGVYGYGTAGIKIPEGYLRVKIDTDEGSEIEQERNQLVVLGGEVEVPVADLLAGDLAPDSQPLADRPDRRQRFDFEFNVNLASAQVVDDCNVVTTIRQVQ